MHRAVHEVLFFVEHVGRWHLLDKRTKVFCHLDLVTG